MIVTMSFKTFICIIILIIICYLAYDICKFITFYIKGIFIWEAYAKLYNPSPNLRLDRKYGVLYKQHWWNSWKHYIKQSTYYTTNDHDLTLYQAKELIYKIKMNGIQNE